MQSSCTILRSAQQWMRTPTAPGLRQHLLLSVFWALAFLVESHRMNLCLTDDMWMWGFISYCYLPSAYLLWRCLFTIFVGCSSYYCWALMSSLYMLSDMSCKYFLPVCGCSFILSMLSFTGESCFVFFFKGVREAEGELSPAGLFCTCQQWLGC